MLWGPHKRRPDAETDRALKEAGLNSGCLGLLTRPGRKRPGVFWKRTYPNAKRWPVPIGKDPTEAAQEGLNLRAWVMAGLPYTAHQEGAQATNTGKTYKDKGTERETDIKPFQVDAGLTDLEALEVIGQC